MPAAAAGAGRGRQPLQLAAPAPGSWRRRPRRADDRWPATHADRDYVRPGIRGPLDRAGKVQPVQDDHAARDPEGDQFSPGRGTRGEGRRSSSRRAWRRCWMSTPSWSLARPVLTAAACICTATAKARPLAWSTPGAGPSHIRLMWPGSRIRLDRGPAVPVRCPCCSSVSLGSPTRTRPSPHSLPSNQASEVRPRRYGQGEDRCSGQLPLIRLAPTLPEAGM